MTMLEQMFQGFPLAEFTQRFFRHQPLARQGVLGDWQHLGSWETVEQILADPQADAFLARGGALWPGSEPITYDRVRQLHAEGYTLVIRHAERQHAPLAQVASEFTAVFQAPVNIHIYCTPDEQHGFGWHYDAEDVFIVQTEGSKEYSLRKNTVNPWPLADTLPANMRYEREISPLMKCRLEAGDWLYLPTGYWHKGQASQAAISLAIGVLATSALDLFDFVRQELLSDLRWRQRLPVPSSESPPSQVPEELQSLLFDLADDLEQRFRSPALLGRFLASRANIAEQAAEHVARLHQPKPAKSANREMVSPPAEAPIQPAVGHPSDPARR